MRMCGISPWIFAMTPQNLNHTQPELVQPRTDERHLTWQYHDTENTLKRGHRHHRLKITQIHTICIHTCPKKQR